MSNGKMVIGAIILLVGLWMLFSLDNAAARYLGGGIVIILGIAQLVAGYKKGGKKGQSRSFQPPSPPSQSPRP